MGIYFAEGIYGIRCVSADNQILFETQNQNLKKYSDQETNAIFQQVNALQKPFDIYLYKSYSTTYDLHTTHSLMWVKSDLTHVPSRT